MPLVGAKKKAACCRNGIANHKGEIFTCVVYSELFGQSDNHVIMNDVFKNL